MITSTLSVLKTIRAMLEAPMLTRQVIRAARYPVRLNVALRSASTFSASATEAMNPHGIEISKAQRIAKDGFVSGMSYFNVLILAEALTDT